MLRLLSRYSMWVLFCGVFLGLAAPGLARLAGPLLPATVVLLLALSLIRLNARDVFAVVRRPAVMAAIFAWQLLICPVAATAVIWLTDLPAPLETAIVLSAACPPIMTSIAFALMFRLDAATVSVQVFGSIVLVPLTLPPLALLLLGLELPVTTLELMGTLTLIIGASFGLAILIRIIVPKPRIDRSADMLDFIAVLLLLVFAIAIMDGVTKTLLERPVFVATVAGASFAVNMALQATTFAAFRWTGPRRAASIGLAAGNRNMGILLAALSGRVDPDILLFFAVGQLPIYMLPLILRRLYLRLSGSDQRESSSMSS